MSAEKHNVPNQKLTLSTALKTGHKIIVTYRDNNLITSFFTKDNAPAGVSSMSASEVTGIADEIMGKYISIEKLQTGHRYKFIPHTFVTCILVCIDKEGMIIRDEKGKQQKELILISLIKRYEKMQQTSNK